MNYNLYSLFEKHFKNDLNKTCLEIESGETFTYQDLHRKSAQYANLLTNMELSKGDRVAVQVE